MLYKHNQCIACKNCINSSPVDAVSFNEKEKNSFFISIDHNLCNRCGVCIEQCPSGTLQFSAIWMEAEEVFKQIIKDKIFYEVSGGGVTFSGGDPLTAPNFVLEVIEKCLSENIQIKSYMNFILFSIIIQF